MPDWFMSNNFFAKLNKEQEGFTLIEVMVALAIAIIGIVGAYGAINQSLALMNSASMRLGAVCLAKEGVEIVRNIRDSNYLNIYQTGTGSWADGLIGCEGGCGADYTMIALDSGPSVYNKPLKLNGNFFGYEAGDATPYKRKITVNNYGNYLEIIAKVSWDERGADKSVEVRENLYNWWEM